MYGLIAFAIISVLSLGGAIFALTNLKQAREDADRLRKRLDEYGSPPAYYTQEASARRTNAFAVLTSDFQKLAELISGQQDAVRPALESEARRVIESAAATHSDALSGGQSLLAAVRALDQALTASKTQLSVQAAQIADLQAARDSLTANLDAARETFNQRIDEISAELARLQESYEQSLTAKDEQVASLQSTVESRAEELNRERTQIANERREAEIALGRLTNQVNELQTQLQAFKQGVDPQEILRKADGRILRAIPGSDVVYVNLGENDGLKPGMGFEVFSTTPDPRQSVRGKASVEVVTVMGDTAECLVKRTTAGQPIVEGDLVVNIAYERNRKPKFVIRGSFDLNYDGVIDSNDVERVTALIREWGGQVQSELDETTDFVVIGTAPVVPEVPPGTPVSPVVQVQVERQAMARQEFQEIIQRAGSMYIPAITQSQFLFHTGYSGDLRTARR